MSALAQPKLLLFPDPLWTPRMISGAAFLYFDDPLGLLVPSSSSLGMLGVGPHKLANLVSEREPQWSAAFMSMYRDLHVGRDCHLNTRRLLEPLRGSSFVWIHLIYPHTVETMRDSEALLRSTGLDHSTLLPLMNPLSSADSLAKHALCEMYVEILHQQHGGIDFAKQYLDNRQSGDPIPPEFERDVEPVYRYCDSLFSSTSYDALMQNAYGMRLVALQRMGRPQIFLSHPPLLDVLSRLPVVAEGDRDASLSDDVVAWEFFRQLLSPLIDPLNATRVEQIVEFRSRRTEELKRFKNKCQSLALKVRECSHAKKLEEVIAGLVKSEVENELVELLQIDRESRRALFDSLLGDEAVWIAVAAFITGLVNGNAVITAGAAIGALCKVGAAGFRIAAAQRRKLRTSEYSLIYNLRRQQIA